MKSLLCTQCLDLIGYTWTNDNTGETRASNSIDAVLFGRVGHALRTDSIITRVPRETSLDDVIYG